jgi:hypothetical protein
MAEEYQVVKEIEEAEKYVYERLKQLTVETELTVSFQQLKAVLNRLKNASKIYQI